MKAVLVAALAVLGIVLSQAFAASWDTIPPTIGFVVTTCGTLPSGVTYTAGTMQPVTMNTTGALCVNQ